MNARDDLNLDQIVELVDHIQRRLEHMSQKHFMADRDEIDLSAFRLSAIGEASRKLSDPLKARHPQINWAGIYAMRNVIAHDYGRIDAERVWLVTQNQLDELATVCRMELKTAD